MKDIWKNFQNFVGRQKDLAAIGVADSIGLVISALFWFLLASYNEAAKFGEVQYFIGIAGIAYTISLFGTQNTITVFTAKNLKIESTLFLISLLAGVIIVSFYRIDAVLLLFGYIVNDLSIAYLLGKKLYQNYSKYIIIQKSLTLVLGLGFFYVFGIEGVLYALALSYIHFAIIIYKGFKNSKVDFSILKTRAGFLTYNYAYGLTGGFRGNIDRILIAPILGFAILGNYAISLQFVSVLMIFSSITYKYLLAHDATGGLNLRLKKGIMVLSVIISVLGSTILPRVIPIIFPKYVDAVGAIQIMSFSVIPATIALIYTSKLLGMEKSKLVLISAVLNVITETVGILTLGSSFGITGVAISFVLGTTAAAVFLTISEKMLK